MNARAPADVTAAGITAAVLAGTQNGRVAPPAVKLIPIVVRLVLLP
jgi:hypothetical protein